MTKPARFKMVGYSGGPVEFAYLGKVIFDLGGMRIRIPLAALREHTRDRATGVIDRVSQEGQLKAEGYFLTTPDGVQVASLLQEGFPMEASIGVYLDTVEELKEDESKKVNGWDFSGPGLIVRKSTVREISFVSLGADENTTVSRVAASARAPQGGGIMNQPENFDQAVLEMLSQGHSPRQAVDEAAKAYPGLYAEFEQKLRGQVVHSGDELAELARRRAQEKGIDLDAATMEVAAENAELVKKWAASL